MKLQLIEPPREYEVGFGPKVTIKDCAHIELAADEQITFTTSAGGEYDVARKNWGFYATPSINGRLLQFGLRTTLVKNRMGRFYVMLVENGCESQFEQYLAEEGLLLCGWLDDTGTLERIENAMKAD